jgi:hypothetical protein
VGGRQRRTPASLNTISHRLPVVSTTMRPGLARSADTPHERARTSQVVREVGEAAAEPLDSTAA